MSRLPGRLGELRAKDIMTRPVITVAQNDTLEAALHTFREQHITGAPVVSDDGKLVGILSLADFMEISKTDEPPQPGTLEHGNQRSVWKIWDNAPALDPDFLTQSVATRMSEHVKSVRDVSTLVDVARLMCDRHWHRVPVVDAYGTLCGMITAMDVLAAMVNVADEPGE
ncbi:CBS domain-containing protein [Thalassoroseus pseudoceratinae]|uniref:CBS domain-containing protein n=1 Tax=Thalassoroseus pseudoceratinae TaxID=2713176 RepID=UPI00141EE8C4|nr:CBS domain-containing protein [Thalassoroseus pseudoceratinae]